MKKLILVGVVLLLPALIALDGGVLQAQLTGISYQAVAVDAEGKGIPGMDLNGQPIPGQSINVRFSILDSSASGVLLYQETHTTNTDIYGLFSLVIGTGNVSSNGQYATLTQIPWQTTNQFLKVEVDVKKDGNYRLVSVQQLMAVPYAFYAQKSDTSAYTTHSDTAVFALNAASFESFGSVWKLTGNDTTNPVTHFIGTTDSVDFVMKTNGTERMRIQKNGNVGIGTGQPDATLSVAGSLGVSEAGGNGDRFVITSTSAGAEIFQRDNSPIIFKTQSGVQEKMRITDEGNIGIGIANPAGKFHVNNDAIGSDSSFVILSNGNVGIGTTTPQNKLQIGEGSLVAGNDIVMYDNFNHVLSIQNFGFSTFSTNSNGFIFNGVGNTPTFLLLMGTLKITDGTEGAGKVLTSDANGLSSWQVPAAAGTIDTMSVSNLSPLFTTSVANPNTAPALSFTLSQAPAYSVFGNSSGVAADPAYFAPVLSSPMFQNQGTANTVLHGNASGNPLWGAVDLSTDVTGTLPMTSVAMDTNTAAQAGIVPAGTGNPNKVWKTDASGNPAWRTADTVQYAYHTAYADTALIALYTDTAYYSQYSDTAIFALSSDAWSIHGNTGLADSNFIGTIDNIPFNIRVNNQPSGRIYPDSANTFFGYQAGINSVFGANTAIGHQALSANTNGYANVAIGPQALTSNTEGYGNVAIGTLALVSNTQGFGNIALGGDALHSNIQGIGNIAIGVRALKNNNSFGNVAIGIDALNSNTMGYGNLAIGQNALFVNTTGFGNIAIGDSVLYTSVADKGNIGIGTHALYANNGGIGNIALGANTLQKNTVGSTNLAFGDSALHENTSGSYNVASGAGSLHYNISGTGNMAMGLKALHSNVSGSGNVAIGLFSMHDNTVGGTNIAIGLHTLNKNISGVRNTAIGDSSLYKNTIGNYNVGVGSHTLYTNIMGNNNTAIGEEVLYFANASGNTGIGAKALYKTTLGDYNTAIGYEALVDNTMGSHNTATGRHAMHSNTFGSRNSVYGAYALYSNSFGSQNVAVGFRTLYSNTIGSLNTAIGDSAMMSNIDGNYNVALGTAALKSITSGDNNIAVGLGALYINTIGDDNTAIGTAAMAFNINGSVNTAVGRSALAYNISGNRNVAIGEDALRNNISGEGNIAIGPNAAWANLYGNYNTAIGYNAFRHDSGLVVFTNATAIGYNSRITASNMVQLGNGQVTDVKTAGAMTANGYTTAYADKSSAYTITLLDDVIAASGTTTITLPTAVGIAGREFTVKNVGTDPITVQPNGVETIDGATTKTLAVQYQYVTLISNGAVWLVVGGN